jgi:putative membrane protein
MLAAIMFTAVACDDDDDNDNPTNVTAEIDKQFLLKASDGSLFEVNAGQVAGSKGTSAAIQDFGEEMVEDHTEINQEIGAIANGLNVDLPVTLSNEMQLKLDTLSALSGMAFDTTFIKMMVSSHVQTVSLFETQATSSSNTEIKAWTSDKLPELREHLERARALQDSIQ